MAYALVVFDNLLSKSEFFLASIQLLSTSESHFQKPSATILTLKMHKKGACYPENNSEKLLVTTDQ
jgi:hypothetical protein